MDNDTDDIQWRMVQKMLLPKQFIISVFFNVTNFISENADKTRERCSYVILDNNMRSLPLACGIKSKDNSRCSLLRYIIE